MGPLQLDMSKLDCKKSLRSLELEAYSNVISALRAQGDLTPKKLDMLKELQSILKISIDRHKSEARRACNDDKLYTIAKFLSHGDCVSTEWIKQSKRNIPLLPSLQATNTSSCYYRILADQILAKAQPVFSLYPEDNSLKTSDVQINEKSNQESEFVQLKNGYAIESNSVKIDNSQPGEFFKRMESETSDNNNKTFLNYLIEKYKQQNEKKENAPSSTRKTVNELGISNQPDSNPKEKDEKTEETSPRCSLEEASTIEKLKVEIDNTEMSQKHQTLIPIQIPYQQLQSQNLKLNSNQPIKLSPSLNPQLAGQKTPKLLIPANKTINNSQKLIILPSNSNINSNLKILTTSQLNQKIVLNVPSVSKPIDTSKRKFCETNVKNSSSNSNLVCLKLDSFNDESNSSTSSKNGFYDLNGSNNKKIKLIEFNPAQAAIPSLIKASSNSNLTNAD